MTRHQGRHFLHIPGPSPVPERVLRAMDMPVIDHRSAEFGELGKAVLSGSQKIFKTASPVIIYPSSGTGAWEAAIVNTLSPGDKVLMVETGHFATLWRQMAARWGVEVDFIPGDWRRGVDPAMIEEKLAADTAHQIKAVMVVHNETSTGATSRIGEVRAAMDRAKHPALLMVDTISGLASADFRFDEWKVDVAVSCSQKGFMLPPGLGFNAVSDRARAVAKTNKMPRSFWDWEDMLKLNANGFFPYTPATNLLYGLREAIAMLLEEGLDEVFARHQRLAAATRAAVQHWGLEVLCQEPRDYSPVLTAVLMPPGHDADQFRQVVLDNYNMSLGSGLSKVAGKVFRIGHLGECNELTLMAALSGVEMGLRVAGVPHRAGGVDAAMALLEQPMPGNAPRHLAVVN
ncbi:MULTISPECIES: pyridoxal-phosphate-dependent aminotransferase family protein [Bradyrhizobium]|uniref:pyridoxal-phosphate-dependent aminotransferase family protein n=3 Tax=Nitrobacteraceae TaxID=41294 RepID=UPI00005DEF90|nr:MULTISPECIES: alanine--glyoxylate aminotransferase family protein [Bradyrhizobium]ABQ37681.1 Serine-glyoxylate aminotransferase [Bradyrhizobium sp. BTAi1]MCL8485136.1 alanine--glyoxylate aminotransferase family protein [Bradyrhizobium denitrificans]RTM05039.1 MAG: alanine--glyoxylate aminotransferase family protein [Bradyrhizobiaceae bacterium]